MNFRKKDIKYNTCALRAPLRDRAQETARYCAMARCARYRDAARCARYHDALRAIIALSQRAARAIAALRRAARAIAARCARYIALL